VLKQHVTQQHDDFLILIENRRRVLAGFVDELSDPPDVAERLADFQTAGTAGTAAYAASG